jgi:hypothetical protein
VIAYEEDTDFETCKSQTLKPKAEGKKSIFNKGNLKMDGVE